MDKNIEFSVIVPLYNKEKYIEESMRSIQRQTYKSYEILVIDDASTDESVSIVKRLAIDDKRIRLISKDNAGPGYARNDGIKEAKGEYILFLDADDFWINDRILEKVSYIIKKLDVKPNVIGTSLCKLLDGKIVNTNLVKNGVEGWLNFEQTEDNIYGFYAHIYKKQFLEENNITFPKARLYEDPVFMAKVVVYAQELYFIEERFYVYRSSMDRRIHQIAGKEQMNDYIECVFDIAKRAKNHNRPLMLERIKTCLRGYYGRNLLRQFAFGNYDSLIKLLGNSNELGFEEEELPQVKYLRTALMEKANHDIEKLRRYVDQYEQIILYGAGMNGRMLATVLLDIGIKSDKLAFCQTYCSEEMKIEGIECKEVGAYSENAKNVVVIVAVNEKLQGEIVNTLTELKFENVILLTEELLCSVMMKL